MSYSPEASVRTRKRIRLEEKAARAAEKAVERSERLNRWLESDRGQMVLVGIVVAVLLAVARIAGLLGN